jgi:hypothetical protein
MALPPSLFLFSGARYTPQNISHDGQAESSPQLLVPVIIILLHERFFLCHDMNRKDRIERIEFGGRISNLVHRQQANRSKPKDASAICDKDRGRVHPATMGQLCCDMEVMQQWPNR